MKSKEILLFKKTDHSLRLYSDYSHNFESKGIAMRRFNSFICALSAVFTLVIYGSVPAFAQEKVPFEPSYSFMRDFEEEDNPSPVVDGVGGYSKSEIAEIQEAIRQAEISGPPNKELVPGQMWSDKVNLPDGIDKTTADESEIKIAKERSGVQLRGLAAAAQCQSFWLSPYPVCGAILDRYNQLGGALSWLLAPIESQTVNPDGQGYRQRFMNGFIYWHPETGAHAVPTHVAEAWARNGWEAGWMGYPTGGEVPITGSTPLDGEYNGWVQTFEGGRIYRSPILDGFQVAAINGLILEKWLEGGGVEGPLGFPIKDETGTPDGEGRFSVFNNGFIYWTADTGAHPVSGEILEKWAESEFEEGPYGYPIGDPIQDSSGNWTQQFEHGEIGGSPHGLRGAIPYSARAGYAEPASVSWDFKTAYNVRYLPTGELRNVISTEYHLGISGLNRVVLTGSYKSLVNVPFTTPGKTCVVKKHERFQRDPEVASFNCDMGSVPRTEYLVLESSAPAAKRGDGEYYMQVDFNLATASTVSQNFNFQSQRWTCINNKCTF